MNKLLTTIDKNPVTTFALGLSVIVLGALALTDNFEAETVLPTEIGASAASAVFLWKLCKKSRKVK
jgi:uncharacterized membrane protein HdeD (DUF308 family)